MDETDEIVGFVGYCEECGTFGDVNTEHLCRDCRDGQ